MTDITISPAVHEGLALAVVDAKSMEVASGIRSQVKGYLKDLTADKEKKTKPMNEALKEIRAMYKPFEDKANAVLDHLDRQMSAYQTAEVARMKAEEAKIAAKAVSGYIKPETAISKLADVVVPEKTVGKTMFVTDYEVVVLDWRLIPEEYIKWEVRTLLVKAALKAKVVIPGVTLREVQRPRNI